ncbi:PhoH family-like protein [Bacillus phage Shbh1]|uniref:PhoH family-like protein n=1 Tax=Bacillus phage Shbh1 TaxID=1796992 RepID=A0A142F1B7_9CAUD|nr:PhoH family-like protein [Bacillus phage Shbh1]AMQ66574.1 PhoH family-like protein [Bacillus phage Shbh1]
MSKNKHLDLSKLTTKEFPDLKRLDWEQQDMVNKLFKHKRVIVDSIAGSGKTTILTQAMKVLLDKGHISKIYYVLFPVQERSLGYLPGGLSDKVKEYALPFHQALTRAGVNPQQLNIDLMCDEFSECSFKVVPHTFLRGRTIEDAGVIIDETQNGTISEIRKTLTRITDTCYIGIAGHTGQKDIKDSGFDACIEHFKKGAESGDFTEIGFAKLNKDYRGEFSAFADKLE